MAYNMNNPGMNPGHETHDEYYELCDAICTRLGYGALWHKRLASQLRKIGIRGEGRKFNVEGEGDYCNSAELEKLLGDNIDYYPEINTSEYQKAVSFTLDSVAEFKPLLHEWIKEEKAFAKLINKAVRYAAEDDAEIYENLCCLWKETSVEAKRAKLLYKRLELAGWNGHDLAVVSMIEHYYYEKHPHDKEGNVNLG